ncbi:hypothetical protein ATO10_05327 [Actibacterium atlanticum]|uniref:RES domain-containing protein n=1 Tax=Actibacterium atlanticum TaxID=1461693 RepID=A0A058ZP43_9RHOB|nr:RES family NAD+ phosphorylase [Actibacterium atlanticum]KCV83005.1 hypothetical protein ATO10_05327 [Actibacterium atlanticum]
MPPFDLTPMAGAAVRFAEDQNRASSMKLVDDLEEQSILEELLDASKPPVPVECAHLHYLLFTPFRYVPRVSSRFRRAGDARGVLYAAENLETAAAETAFYALLFYAESPDTAPPNGHVSRTCFKLRYRADAALDLTVPPYSDDATLSDPVDYTASLALAEAVRDAGGQVIRSTSVRDPGARANINILSCDAIENRPPSDSAGWQFWVKPEAVLAKEDFCGGQSFEFRIAEFANDPRIQSWLDARR